MLAKNYSKQKKCNCGKFIDKVYCSNCKYFRVSDFNDEECHSRSNISLSGNWLKKFKIYNLTPENKNDNNRCLFFEKVWYKFWVK